MHLSVISIMQEVSPDPLVTWSLVDVFLGNIDNADCHSPFPLLSGTASC